MHKREKEGFQHKVPGNEREWDEQRTKHKHTQHKIKAAKTKIGLDRTNASHQCSMPTREREANEERPGRFLFTSLLLPTFAHWLCSSLSVAKKKIKRLEEVAVWHLVKKIQKIRTKKHTAAGEGELLLANENVSTLSSKKIHSYTCNLGKMGH